MRDSDHTPGPSPARAAGVRHLVVLGGPDPATTDALAALLRDTCTVRTAYTTSEVLDRLATGVDAVVLDPGLGAAAVETVADAAADRDLDCQVGLLADSETVAPAGVDAVVPRSADDRTRRDAVERLAVRGRYRKTLDEYYHLVKLTATGDADPTDTADRTDDGSACRAELDRLRAQLDRLRAQLDAAADELDVASLFDATLEE